MKKILRHIDKHVRKHKKKLIGIAVLFKLMTMGIVMVFGIQTLQHISAADTIYNIDISAGEFWTTSPKSDTKVNEGDSLSITITANDGYHISKLIVDDIDQNIGHPSSYSYTFTNVQKSHTITASFWEKKQYAINITTKGEGTTSPQSTIANEWSNTTISFLPNLWFGISTIDIQWNKISLAKEYTIVDIQKNHEITVDFIAIPSVKSTQVICEGNKNSQLTITYDTPLKDLMIPTTNIITDQARQPISPTLIDGNITIPLANDLANGTYTLRILPETTRTTEKATIFSTETITVPFTAQCQKETSSWWWGWSRLQKDDCPYWDYSPSYYDKDCWSKPTNTGDPDTKCNSEEAILANLDFCLWLTDKVNKLATLNDNMFIWKTNDAQDTNPFITALQQAATQIGELTDNTKTYLSRLINNKHPAPWEDETNIINILQYMSNEISVLNDNLISDIHLQANGP